MKQNNQVLTIMFMKKVLYGCAALLFMAACNNGKDTTTLKFDLSGGEATFLEVSVPGLIDTTLTLENKQFTLEIPVCKTVMGAAQFDDGAARFVSDGTTLTFSFDDEGILKVKSDNAKKSLTERWNVYHASTSDIFKEYSDACSAIEDSTSLSDEEMDVLLEEAYNKLSEAHTALCLDAISKNADNALGVVALRSVYSDVEDDTLKVILESFDSTVAAANPMIGALKESIAARESTAEGCAFKDFTLTQPDGTEASLSDYVGKGKYVLVDFWASWCGPCKRMIPVVKSVYEKYKGKDFDVLSVAVWERGNYQASIDTAKVYGVTWNEMLNGESVPTELYGINGIPHIVLFGPDGTIIKRGLYGDEIEEEVAKYVAAK